MELHRENTACANCHRKIDPWGIAFENFSAVGRWRGDKSEKEFVADAALTTLPDGTTISSVQELRQYLLMHRRSDFARALSKSLFTFALGRSLDFSDDELINSVSAGFAENDFQIRWLIEEIVVSKAFRSR